ncbi:MAG: bifunctional riboflavin kinase/FAD synthetase [Crocinitomicaceae bacterium]|nr:bifunctional riboflavin kinase/FAD synthetase [Crocinitomicaceae bacterium]
MRKFVAYNQEVRIYKGIDELGEFKNSVVTIGTFDGVHKGHQKILSRLNKLADEISGESILFTFYPHPRMVVFPDNHNLKLIQTIDEKIDSLEKLGLDNLIIYPFTKAFSRLTAFEFVRDILVEKLKVKTLVIGYDHQFGRNREGDLEFLKETAKIFDFKVEEISAEEVQEVNVSSTKIRQSLLEGDIEKTNGFLGRPFRYSGVVVEGQKIGRTIGFPTANIEIKNQHKILPKDGVYAVRVQIGGALIDGMMNIGMNPTVLAKESLEKKVEVHLFDFNTEVYGEHVAVFLYRYIRKEKTFSNLEALKSQLNDDSKKVRNFFNHLEH